MLARLAYAAGAFSTAAQLAFRPRNEASLATVPAQTAYRSASTGRRALGWWAPGSGPNDAVLGGLATIRARNRAAVRDDPYAKAIIRKQVTAIVGTGIKPLFQVQDPVLRAKLQRDWLAWTDQSDADGVLDFYGQQAMVCQEWLEAGEIFTRLRPRLAEDGLLVPLQLQLLEADHCPLEETREAGNGNRIRAGIEIDKIGRKVAYWMHRTHPGDSTTDTPTDAGRLTRIRAEEILHVYEPVRAGQLRGLPSSTQVLIALRELHAVRDSTVFNYRLGNMLTGFLKRSPLATDPTINPLTNQPITTDAAGLPMVGFEPGTIQELGPGESLEWSTPPGVSATFESFVRGALQEIAVGADMAYEILTGDWSKVNDRTARVLLNDFRRRVEQWQAHQIAFQFCRPVARAWLTRAVTAGVLDLPMAEALAIPIDWTPQRQPYINPVQDIQALRDEMRIGRLSPQEMLSDIGGDMDDTFRKIAAAKQLAKDLGLVFDWDASRVAQTGVAQQSAPAPAEEAAV